VTSLGLWLLEVLEATHRAGVVHRDVKPSNVQLCGERVVLTDFGIATTTQDGSGSFNGRVTGSPAYMAPEQVQGAKAEPASDLFSLGATLYTAVEGRSPFGRGCLVATLTAVVDDPPAPFRRAGPPGHRGAAGQGPGTAAGHRPGPPRAASGPGRRRHPAGGPPSAAFELGRTA
jgi:serine/threonine protein kinase